MHLRYQVLDNGKVSYQTESFTDAKRYWQEKIGSNCIIVDVLHRAGLVPKPGDNEPINALANECFERLLDRFKVNATPAMKAEFFGWLTDELEKYLVKCVTSSPISVKSPIAG